jgi:hypothetical protein
MVIVIQRQYKEIILWQKKIKRNATFIHRETIKYTIDFY